jgi:endonuclease/exonuclease/phosphatase (EEP) superfamily protein YafD
LGFLARLFVGLTIFALVATAILAELGEIWWVADLFGHFRFPYLVIAALALLVAILVRPRWRALLVVLAAAPHAWAIGTYPTAPWSTQSDTGTRLRVVTANLHYDNSRLAHVAAWLRRTNADILCLQEIVGTHARLVAALRGAYPHFGPLHSRSDTVLFSRHPIVRQRVELPGEYLRRNGRSSPGEGYPFHIADIRTPGGRVRVI